MTSKVVISFAARSPRSKEGLAVLLAAGGAKFGDSSGEVDPGKVVEKATKVAAFTGKALATLDVLAPGGSPYDRILAVGVGEPSAVNALSWLKLGGAIQGQVKKSAAVTVYLQAPGFEIGGAEAAGVALGMLLRAYRFDRYRTKKDESENGDEPKNIVVTIVTAAAAAAKKAFADAETVAAGVTLARDLVNEPANKLGPVEFAASAKELTSLGVQVEVLTEKEMKKLGMGALLGVAQGSARPPRLVVMQWNGGKPKEKPVAFIGKGVVFDSGGLSIKPAQGMEDMKGDMGGAAAVTGLIRTLAARKAKVNAVGVIGCVENMVDGTAQRPGDIVTSMSGQTIEVLNTDAEGRLVLADGLSLAVEEAPDAIVDIATLTGAALAALGPDMAAVIGSNADVVGQVEASAAAADEPVWELPLAADRYRKLLDSVVADMKNVGGPYAGATTAAIFLSEFVGDVPWAHIDIAGPMNVDGDSGWKSKGATGFGTRLLIDFATNFTPVG